MICWFLLVPAGVPVLVSLLLSSLVPVLVSFLLSSFFPQERGSVPSWFAGSSWFRLGFRCLSTFFSLLCFRCLSPFFSLLWFRCLSPFFSLLSFLRKGVLFHHDLLVLPGSGWGSGACLPSSFLRKGVLFHHDFLIPPGSGWGSGACLPSFLFFLFSGKGFCSIMIYWFLLVPARFRCLSPFFSLLSFLRKGVLFHHGFFGSSSFLRGFRCLSPFFSLSFLRKGVLFQHDFLVPPASGWGSGACLPSPFFLFYCLVFVLLK